MAGYEGTFLTGDSVASHLRPLEGPGGPGVDISEAPARNNRFGDLSLLTGLVGAFTGGFGAYVSGRAQQHNDLFQADISDFNARMFERAATDIMHASQIMQGQIALKAGQVQSAQKASQGARGIAIGVGSAADEVATTNLMKEIDMLQLNANAVRQAGAMRMRGVSAQNQALMSRARARSSSPLLSAATSFLGGALPVAANWYRRHKV